MSDPNELNPAKETHKTAQIFEILGGVLLVLLAGWFIVSYLSSAPTKNTSGVDAGATLGTKPPTKEEMIRQMSVKASTTATVSADEKQKMIDAMLQKAAPSQGGTGVVSGGAAPVPTVTAAEKRKMIDAMRQKTQ